jgi:hypothetical protein
VSAVGEAHIKLAVTDAAGEVCLLLLDDVTGERYTYGFLNAGSVTEGSGAMAVTNDTASVTNSDGVSQTVIGATDMLSGTAVGIAPSLTGTLSRLARLSQITGGFPSAFRQASDGSYSWQPPGLYSRRGNARFI